MPICTYAGHSKSFDHWSWAILVHELLVGDVPFKEKVKIAQMKLFKAIVKGSLAISDAVDDDTKDLLNRILVVDQVGRLGSLAGGAKDISGHAWLAGIDLDAISQKTIEAPWKPNVSDPLKNFEDFSHEEFEATVQVFLSAPPIASLFHQ